MSIPGFNPRFGLVVTSSTFGGFGGSLTLSSITIEAVRAPRGTTMPLGVVGLLC